MKDLTNKKIGNLTVLKFMKKNQHNVNMWLCKCVCGQEKEIATYNLLAKRPTISCGCIRRLNLINKKFGRLKVKKYVYSKNKKVYWECLCDCKNIKIVSTRSLVSGETTSCGCKLSEKKLTLEIAKQRGIEKGFILKSNFYKNSKTKLLWECCNQHIFESNLNDISTGYGCPYCSKQVPKTIKFLHNLAEQNNGQCLHKGKISFLAKITWQCEKGHIWKSIYRSIQNGSWCPECAKEKIKQTCLERYGTTSPLGNEKIRKKIEQTCLERYGVKCASQNKKIALKTAKSSNNSYILFHWKTKEELVCVGSYEKKVIEYLNKNKINFLWQPKVFKTPFKSKNNICLTYRPDLYLVDENKWIEIKGWLDRNKETKSKWLWFHSKYLNSELWDKKKLKKMEIL